CRDSIEVRLFFFFQAEDGIRDFHVSGVQTCALPISRRGRWRPPGSPEAALVPGEHRGVRPERTRGVAQRRRRRGVEHQVVAQPRSEERRVGRASTCWGKGYRSTEEGQVRVAKALRSR